MLVVVVDVVVDEAEDPVEATLPAVTVADEPDAPPSILLFPCPPPLPPPPALEFPVAPAPPPPVAAPLTTTRGEL